MSATPSKPSSTNFAEIADKETGRARAEVIRLDNEERKLLSAHYADSISDHIFDEERRRIRRERAAADQLLGRYQVDRSTLGGTLDLAPSLTRDTQAAYLHADPAERRLLNQAFFEGIEIDTEDVTGSTLAEPFAQIVGVERLLANGSGSRRPTRASNGQTPAVRSNDGGSYVRSMVVGAGGFEPP